VLDLAADVLKRVPEEIDYEQTAKIMADDPSPLNVVLLQEVRSNLASQDFYKSLGTRFGKIIHEPMQ
jgi:dynein heavy chain